MILILSNSNLNVSDYLSDVPKYVSSSESYIEVGESKKDLIMDKILKYAIKKKYNIIIVLIKSRNEWKQGCENINEKWNNGNFFYGNYRSHAYIV